MTTSKTPRERAPSRRPRQRSLLPREHGAWAELGFPVIAALLLGRGTMAAALLTAATVAVFLVHEPILVLLGRRGSRARRQQAQRAQRRSVGLAGVALVTGIIGLLSSPTSARVSAIAPACLGALLGVFMARGSEKSLPGELVAALALTSPALPIALANAVPWRIAATNAAVWTGVAVLATLSVRAVTARVRDRSGGGQRLRAVASTVSGLAVAACVVAAAVGWLSWWIALAIVVAGLFALLVAWKRPHPRHLKALGFALVAVQTWVLLALWIDLG